MRWAWGLKFAGWIVVRWLGALCLRPLLGLFSLCLDDLGMALNGCGTDLGALGLDFGASVLQ